MHIPFANRTADILIPAVAGLPKVMIKSVIDEFQCQFPKGFQELFKAFVLLSPRLVCVTCKSSCTFEEFKNSGVSFKESLIQIRPCRSAKWVNLTRLSYGIQQEAIVEALQPYGHVFQVKMDQYQGVYVSVQNILMEISKPIPSSIRVAEHWCNVFYQGQIPTCFAMSSIWQIVLVLKFLLLVLRRRMHLLLLLRLRLNWLERLQ